MPAQHVLPPVLRVQTDGSGPPLVLLPGFTCGAEAWGVIVVRTLAERFRVLRPDWPGVGGSPAVTDERLAITALAGGVLRALDVHAAPRARVLGWGLGALAALQLAVDCPERVERLVLLGGAASGEPLRAESPTVAALCGVAEGASPEEHMLGLLGRLVSPSWRPFAELFLPQLLPRPAATLAALRGQWAALAGFDLRAQLHRVRAPTLVLAGAEDRLTPPALAEHLRAGIAGAELRVIAGAGHAAMWEQPGEVLHAVIPFLDGVATSAHAHARPHRRPQERSPR